MDGKMDPHMELKGEPKLYNVHMTDCASGRVPQLRKPLRVETSSTDTFSASPATILLWQLCHCNGMIPIQAAFSLVRLGVRHKCNDQSAGQNVSTLPKNSCLCHLNRVETRSGILMCVHLLLSQYLIIESLCSVAVSKQNMSKRQREIESLFVQCAYCACQQLQFGFHMKARRRQSKAIAMVTTT